MGCNSSSSNDELPPDHLAKVMTKPALVNEQPIKDLLLSPDFEKDSNKIEGVYKMEVPPEITDVCKTIEDLGGRGMLVGGSVRDMIINQERRTDMKPKDFDVEVYGFTLEELDKILVEKFGRDKVNFGVGAAFGIIKVYVPGITEPLDFSVPREDNKTGVGHKGFTIAQNPKMTLVQAAKRRDITINSTCYDPLTKCLYDPYGGVEDIKSQTIRMTDEKTFIEDPLRVLRVAQFASRLNFRVDKKTLDVCALLVQNQELEILYPVANSKKDESKERIGLSVERVREEFEKLILKGIRPSVGLEILRKIGYVEKYMPELNALIGVQQEHEWHPEGDVWTHTLQVADAAAKVATREKLNDEQKLVLVYSAICHDLGKPPTTKFEDGRIRSRGHEEAGVEPSRNLLNRFYNDMNGKKGLAEITKQVLPLVAEHLKPKQYWLNATKKVDDSPESEDTDEKLVDPPKALKRLAKRLAEGKARKNSYPDGGGTNLYMLALLAEADQEGRNPKENKSLEREEVEELEEWQSWFLEIAKELKIADKPLPNYFKGEEVM